MCVEHYKQHKIGTKIKKYEYRDMFTTNKNIKGTKIEYLIKSPQDIREFATTEFRVTLNNHLAKIASKEYCLARLESEPSKRDKIISTQKKILAELKKFSFKFRKKKDGHESITIPKECVKIAEKKMTVYPRYKFGEFIFRGRSKRDKKFQRFLLGTCKHAIKIIRDENKYYLSLLSEIEPINPTIKKDVIALDPGIRSFLTGYNPEGEILDICQSSELDKIMRRIRYLKKLRKSTKHIYAKLKNKIKDMHCKIAKYLTAEYKRILLPIFETRNIQQSNLNRVSKDNLSCLSHYKFKCRLRNKAELNNSEVFICGERLTTKTCSRCFRITDVGSSKTFKCSQCDNLMDRDINAAKNILIHQIREIRFDE
jgi:putative transposase